MSPNRPVIGDFRNSPNNAPRKKVEEDVTTAPPEPDTRETEKVVAKEVAELQQAAKLEEALTPVEKYQKRLREANISPETAANIYDTVLSKGYYEEYVYLAKSGARAAFRTRMYEDALRLQTALEFQKPQLAITQDELVTRYNLAASLAEWQGKPVKHETDDDFAAALKLVRSLPGPVYSLLANKLIAFDVKVMTVFSDGAAENFS